MKSPTAVERTDIISSKSKILISSKTCFGFHRGRASISLLTGSVFIRENKLADLSLDFAVDILRLCENIKGHYSIVNQIERSATSIGANIREVNYAHSKADFISKLQISLKECYETEYWLEIMEKSEIVDNVEHILHNCAVMRKILISSLNTAKSNK